ncbi:MAG: phytanoyl-CoA dioxygenase family protein [Sneathiella sp.]
MISAIEAYKTDGYCVTEPAFSAHELGRVSALLDHACERAVLDKTMADSCVFERDQPKEKRGGIEVGCEENAVFIIGDIPRFCPEILPFIVTDEIVTLVSELLQTTDVVTHFANLTMKSPKIGSGINWHRDYPNRFISPVSPVMVRTMICIDGMTDATGATCFLKGSHHDPDYSAAPGGFDESDVAIATCAPGSIVAVHPLILHGGGPNKAATPRRNIVIQWGRKDVPLATNTRESITGKTVSELQACLQKQSFDRTKEQVGQQGRAGFSP